MFVYIIGLILQTFRRLELRRLMNIMDTGLVYVKNLVQ